MGLNNGIEREHAFFHSSGGNKPIATWENDPGGAHSKKSFFPLDQITEANMLICADLHSVREAPSS
jgi:hypothetical protein